MKAVILYNIRSTENVGAMFRTADAAGIGKIYLVGYTPAPLDRFGRKNSRLSKASLGAEEFVPWESAKSISALIARLKKDDYQVIGVEQDSRSIDYKKLKLKKSSKSAFIMGAEVTGIPKNVLDKCDVIIEIPMQGKKESLNVSVALGVVLFNFCP
ncbi:MAG TPA: TrmH family RNA methyltransferase [Candidatus Paceibacterota bacterium]|nr:TrmH family RNA methyltransferase [Candidatus Paceibacterota bacterium]